MLHMLQKMKPNQVFFHAAHHLYQLPNVFFFSPARESIMPMLQLTQDEKPIIWQSFKCPRGQALEGLGKRLGMSTCGLEVESRDVVNDPENDENHEV